MEYAPIKYRVKTAESEPYFVMGFCPENTRKNHDGTISFTIFMKNRDQDCFENDLDNDSRIICWKILK